MADPQKTEAPTPKRRREARRDGRVARSGELGSWFSLLVLVLALPPLLGRAAGKVTVLTALVTSAMSSADSTQCLALLGRGLWTVIEASGPIVIIGTVAAAAAGVGQVGFRFAPGALGFKWTKISPRSGLKRIFSPGGAWEAAKMFSKLLLLVGIGYLLDRHLVENLLGASTPPIEATFQTAGAGTLDILRDVAAAALALALGDYAFQRHRFHESMKMTRDELRREFRETEVNPEIRRAIRQRRRRLTRLQILAAVARADVVIVNPTHFSVALRYDRAKDSAPRVLAKGEDEDALAIRTMALERGVPLVENPPVARSLYEGCEIGDIVPTHLYQVVARVLAFVYRLTPAARALVDVHKMAA